MRLPPKGRALPFSSSNQSKIQITGPETESEGQGVDACSVGGKTLVVIPRDEGVYFSAEDTGGPVPFCKPEDVYKGCAWGLVLPVEDREGEGKKEVVVVAQAEAI